MTYKRTAATFITVVTTMSLYACMKPTYYVQLFINTSILYSLCRIVIALAIAGYVLIPAVRFQQSQVLMRAGGLALLVLSVIGLFSPQLFGLLPQALKLVDIIFGIEAGVLSILVSLELSIGQLRLPLPYVLTTAFYRKQLRAMDHSASVGPAKQTMPL